MKDARELFKKPSPNVTNNIKYSDTSQIGRASFIMFNDLDNLKDIKIDLTEG
ncbi:MAG: hypothetical protein HRT87_07410 [Legionellales bacterium]|nr:hypothetical protein [Legionellales bacterium]